MDNHKKIMGETKYEPSVGEDIVAEFSPLLCAPDNTVKCGIENCHGLDIKCGPNPAQICTEMYQLGDKCRQYAKCLVQDGTCRLGVNPDFTACKACVEACEKDNADPMSAFECESRCE